jgi:hypothetical protein
VSRAAALVLALALLAASAIPLNAASCLLLFFCGGGGIAVQCSANGLDYTNTCDTVYHMGIFQ